MDSQETNDSARAVSTKSGGSIQRAVLFPSIVLILLNTVGVGWLIFGYGKSGEATSATLSVSQVAQMEKLFRVMTEFHNELKTVVGQAAYESEDEKAAGKLALQKGSIAYGLSRLDYQTACKSRSVRDFQVFVSGAFQERVGFTATMDAPRFQRYVPAKYDSNFKKLKEAANVTYANVSKLESLQDQFKVLTLSLMEDIK